MDTLPGTQLTDQWMVNPWMFDPSQKSNQFSLFNNQRLPYPPTYSGVPTDAMGNPIQSFVDWQKANPAGTTINQTPAQPAQAAQPNAQWAFNNALLNSMGRAATAQGGPSQQMSDVIGMRAQNNAAYGMNPGGNPATGGVWGNYGGQGSGPTGTPSAAQGQAGPPPNNWQAALNALANPGRVTTPGVPLSSISGGAGGTAFQPAGGVNQAFLSQAGAGQGMNANFLSALRAIQGR